ncbi:H/ACA RNA-protein complex protein Gar1 [Haloarcula taiwanensis]|uniref:H/ACA RNA-protein complex protein Gar1 n=1 Tax=Haloarcula taiwanensis TaxID=1932004 RepID=A0A2H4ZW54_9EURY|nr:MULTISPECIES: Gar1/Naf1 family protein [Haloarcula]AUG46711.1 H/ACA RNA-protein complex protein Gar1 [Haloarcula taiwanensis]RLM36915.1 H/ACA RNA-protein complex protein Gar1 [Haloarcula sp. Atlit-120R]RLM44697.1 H/ACA RNA-protein complex protein Gar1 [Haloarcula sp. Atlit-47R]
MKRLGTVSRVAQGLAVVRAPDDEYASVGTDVVDEELQAVGSVVDVFGPVERPYLAVSPNDGVHLPALVGTVLYAR